MQFENGNNQLNQARNIAMETKKDGEQRITECCQGLCGSWAINYIANHSLALGLLVREISFSKWNQIPGRVHVKK